MIKNYNWRLVEEIPDLIKLLDTIGCDYWYGLELIKFDKVSGQYVPVFKHEEIINLLETLGNLQKFIKLKIVPKFAPPLLVSSVNTRFFYNLQLPEHYCGAGITFAYLDWKGNIYPCDRAICCKNTEYIYQGLENKKVHLSKIDVIDIFTTDLFKAFAFIYASDNLSPNVCKKCVFYKNICNPCPVILKEANQNGLSVCYACELLEKDLINNLSNELVNPQKNYEMEKHVVFYKESGKLFDFKNNEIYQINDRGKYSLVHALYESKVLSENDMLKIWLKDSFKYKLTDIKENILDTFYKDLKELLNAKVFYEI